MAQAQKAGTGRESGLETVQIGRQAIYDASLHSRAYELFYRPSRERPEAKSPNTMAAVTRMPRMQALPPMT